MGLFKKKEELPNDRISTFLKWYTENYEADAEDVKEMRVNIDRIAYYYELRYPEVTIENIIWRSNINKADEIFFKKNQYLKETFKEESDVYTQKLPKLLNLHTFFSLFSDYKWIMKRETEKVDINVWKDEKSGYLKIEINKKGYIKAINDHLIKKGPLVVKAKFNEIKDIQNIHITKLAETLEGAGYVIKNKDDLEKTIKRFNNALYLRQEFLYCVMYRIMEINENKIGQTRALLFADEHKLDPEMIFKYNKNNIEELKKLHQQLLENDSLNEQNNDSISKIMTEREIEYANRLEKKKLYQALADTLKTLKEEKITEIVDSKEGYAKQKTITYFEKKAGYKK